MASVLPDCCSTTLPFAPWQALSTSRGGTPRPVKTGASQTVFFSLCIRSCMDSRTSVLLPSWFNLMFKYPQIRPAGAVEAGSWVLCPILSCFEHLFTLR